MPHYLNVRPIFVLKVHGADLIASTAKEEGYFLKCIVNQTDAVFFQALIQHRDMKASGVSYEDDYKGNAMAATITPGVIDVRYHEQYDDSKVAQIFRDILIQPETAPFSTFAVRYQGRSVVEGA